MASERSKKAAMSAMMSIRGSAASRLCMTMTGTRWRATTSAISGSRCRPQTSLTIAAPRSSAQAAIVAFIVSIETGCPEHTTAGSTNSSRRSSSSAETATAWGRVDSAPMSMMSTPSIIICLACATAASGGRKAPPSENESGVTFSIPMTNGRRSASRAERTSAFAACRVVNAPETGGDVAIMARMCAVAHAVSSETAPAFSRFSGTRSRGIEPAHGALPILTCIVRSTPRRALSRAMTHESWLLLPSVRNFHRKLFGVVDPALDCVLRGQYANEFSDRVCLRHRLSEPRRIAKPEFLDSYDAGGFQELGIFLSDSFDAHAIDKVGDAEQLLLLNFCFFRKHPAAFDTLGSLEQLCCCTDSDFFHFDCKAWPQATEFRDRGRHDYPQARLACFK